MPPVNPATNPATSGCPRSDSAASCRPAAPAFSAGRQRRHHRVGQHVAGRCPLQQRCGLARGEAQLARTQLGQLPPGPQPGQGQGRVTAAGQHQVQPGRPVLQQELQRRVHRLGANHVIVVEDQPYVLGAGLVQLVDQGGQRSVERLRRRGAEQRCDPFADPRVEPVQRGYRVAPEPGRVVVGGVQ